MAGLWDGIYSVFFKRTTTYVPMLLVGAYFSNQALDYAVDTFWTTTNKGKSFQDMVQAVSAAKMEE